jgi:hypothetical protein
MMVLYRLIACPSLLSILTGVRVTTVTPNFAIHYWD